MVKRSTPKTAECPDCGEKFAPQGLPGHRKNVHGVGDSGLLPPTRPERARARPMPKAQPARAARNNEPDSNSAREWDPSEDF